MDNLLWTNWTRIVFVHAHLYLKPNIFTCMKFHWNILKGLGRIVGRVITLYYMYLKFVGREYKWLQWFHLIYCENFKQFGMIFMQVLPKWQIKRWFKYTILPSFSFALTSILEEVRGQVYFFYSFWQTVASQIFSKNLFI